MYGLLVLSSRVKQSQNVSNYQLTLLNIPEEWRPTIWNTIVIIATNNRLPLHIIHNLRNKLITKTQQTLTTQTHQKKKWITFTYYSPLKHKITNLFKHPNLNVTFHSTDTIYKQLSDKTTLNRLNSSGIYKLKCNTCNNSYVGQIGRSIGIRHKEHTWYIKTNNPVSAYALHTLNNKHKYGNTEKTLKLLKPWNKGTKINCWQSFCIHVLQKQNILIDEQRVSDLNPLSWHNMLHYITRYSFQTSVYSWSVHPTHT